MEDFTIDFFGIYSLKMEELTTGTFLILRKVKGKKQAREDDARVHPKPADGK